MSNSDNQEKIPFTVDSKSGSNQNYGSHPLLNNDSNDSSPHSNHESVTASTFTTGLSFREALQETISAIELRPRASIIGINNNSPMPAPLMFRIQGREAVEVRDHCHRPRSEGIDVKARRKLIVASILCLCFMICEVIGGVLSNSLAIATDAAHLLTDFAGFMISLLAIWIAGRPSTQRMSFGWYRAEIIGALASVVLIWFITAILVWLAIERVVNQDFELDAKIMLITSGLAIVINIIMGLQLQHGHTHGMGLGGHGHSHSHSHSHGGEKAKKKKTIRKAAQVTTPVVPDPNSLSITPKGDGNGDSSTDLNLPATESQSYSYQNSTHINTPPNPPPTNESTSKSRKKANHNPEDVVNMNVRAAFIHVIGDVVQSIGVFIAALIIYFRPDWALADPICTFIFSIIVLITTFSILKDAILVLMEGTPGYMRYTEVMESFKQIDGVERVHNLRIWALSVNKVALAAHLVIREHYDPKKILEEANSLVHQQYNFFETTIQIEEYSSSMENCSQCEVPPS